ncbi:MAG: bifunctional hydroxymethylpyrimidine kinase/phosphomethylpyrimidine kinase [Pseudoxanthomonas suwonensis]|nr:bifunctional hydroxymethylpyrimidine kinase/phosphomethylpyrimidine kinase [Pseudoxanthomonas suwonensis]
MLTQADAITPSACELSQIGGRPVDTLEHLIDATRCLRHGRIDRVVATSALPAQWPSGRTQMVLVSGEHVEMFEQERVDATPNGAGDPFSATLACHVRQRGPLAHAIRAATEVVVPALHAAAHVRSAVLLIEPALRRPPRPGLASATGSGGPSNHWRDASLGDVR